MKICINNKLINRNKKIAQLTLYFSLALLAVGFIWTIRNPEPSKATVGYLILVPSYLLVQVSIYLANRWGKSPRPDEIVTQALKGLDDKFTLYTYSTGVPNLLIGPIGILIINPYHHSGEISYDVEKKRYVQKGGPNFLSKYFSQEGLPNITKNSKSLKAKLLLYFSKNKIQNTEEPQIINIFSSENVVLNTKNAPEIALKSEKLKDYIRKTKKNRKNICENCESIKEKLPPAN
jgi:hypothetical protein